MKLKFKQQQYQDDAVESAVDCFKGQPKLNRKDLIARYTKTTGKGFLQTSEEIEVIAFGNHPITITENERRQNIREVQRRNDISYTDNAGLNDFTIEMETGTGKTYTYIKTMYELNKAYGWSKFIVMVPSIAIREGVQKSFEMTEDHFQELYHNKIRKFVYNSSDSSNISNINSFASDDSIQAMIINYQAFSAKGAANRRIYEKLDELQKIFANAEEQLEALGMEMPNEPEQIEEAIKALNRPVVSKENEKYFGENGYRNVNVGLGNRDVGFLRKEQVPQAMKLYSQSISDFVQSSDELTDEEYVSKVARLQFRFTRIHPFPDGNGRTARAISNILLLRRNLCAVFDKRTKQEYSKQISGIFNDYEEYNEALCTNQSACDKIESQNIYRLEEYIGINCLNRTDLFEDRNITSELSEVKQYGQFR